jgi:hypothetical protein
MDIQILSQSNMKIFSFGISCPCVALIQNSYCRESPSALAWDMVYPCGKLGE